LFGVWLRLWSGWKHYQKRKRPREWANHFEKQTNVKDCGGLKGMLFPSLHTQKKKKRKEKEKTYKSKEILARLIQFPEL
jgi:hypothetical protein